MFKRVHTLNVEEKIAKFCRKNIYFFAEKISNFCKKKFLLNICNFFLLKFRVHMIYTLLNLNVKKTFNEKNEPTKKKSAHL